MNEQAPMMNQPMMNPPPPPTAMMSAMNQQPPPQMMNPQPSQPPPQMLMNPSQTQQPQPQMMNRGYGMWGHPPPSQPMDLQLKYQNPIPNKTLGVGGFGKPPSKHQLGPRSNWKGKKVNKLDKRKDLGRRMENPMPMVGVGGGGGSGAMGIAGNSMGSVGGGFNNPPTLQELQYQNRVKTRRYFQKNYYNNNKKNNMGKFAPRNTTSFIIRAKKSGGIAELVSPCPVTPAVLPTPVFSPSREVLVDMAKEEWGVDGYGSMKGLIRLRSPGNEGEEEDEDEGSSESDVEEHVEVERRLDHDLSRFEMIYPNYGSVGGMEYNNVLENRVDDQDSHIAQLEEENLILKERLFLMERELGDLRRRLQSLERQRHGDYGNEEVVENLSENESDSRCGGHSNSMEDINEELGEENVEGNSDSKAKVDNISDDPNRDALKFEEDNVEIRGHELEQEEVKDNVLKSNEQGVSIKDCNNHGEVPGNSTVQVEMENKDEIRFRDAEQDVQNNEDDSNNVEALEKTHVGGDVYMDEAAHDGKELTEEN